MAIVGDENGGCARIAISPSFPNLLSAVCRSSNVSPLQDICSGLFFFRDNFDDEVVSLKVCCKRWRRSRKNTSRPQPSARKRPQFSTDNYCFRQGSSCDSKIIFCCPKAFSSASCMCVEGLLKQEKVQRCWFVDGKVPSIRMQVKQETFLLISFLNNVIESAKQNYTCCNLALKPLLEFLNQIKCKRNEVTEERRR